MTPADPNRRRVIAWALYDWANSAFMTSVSAGFFPILNKDYWSPPGTPETASTFRLGLSNSMAGLVIALFAPLLGAIADRGAFKKRFLFVFVAVGVLCTAVLSAVGQGNWNTALVLYALGYVGFLGANIFYDSLLVEVAEEHKLDMVSALGYALGYLGGGLLFAVNVTMVLRPGWFGMEATGAARFAFLLVAVWWAVFSIPLFLFVPENRSGGRTRAVTAVREGIGQLRQTFREIRKIRVVFLFLAGYWLYIDGVDTIILMAVNYGRDLHFSSSSLITALLITQFVGFPAAVGFGKIGERLGAKAGILMALVVYVGVTVSAFFMTRVEEFYVLATVIGLVQGGVQSLSRSLYARLIPKDKAGEFFGFYNMLGKFAAIIGPVLMGTAGRVSGNVRYSVLVLLVLFISGGFLLSLVKVPGEGDASGRASSSEPRGERVE